MGGDVRSDGSVPGIEEEALGEAENEAPLVEEEFQLVQVRLGLPPVVVQLSLHVLFDLRRQGFKIFSPPVSVNGKRKDGHIEGLLAVFKDSRVLFFILMP
jgi:hypothetical protein